MRTTLTLGGMSERAPRTCGGSSPNRRVRWRSVRVASDRDVGALEDLCGEGASAGRPGPGRRARRGVRLSRPERRGEVDDDPAPPRAHSTDVRPLGRLRARRRERRRRRSQAHRLPARRSPARRPPDRARTARFARAAARERRRAAPRRALRAAAGRSRSADPPALQGEPPEAGARPGVHAPARSRRPRRADGRARPAAPGRGALAAARDRGRRAHRLPLVALARRGPARRGPRRHDPGRPPHRRRRRRDASASARSGT